MRTRTLAVATLALAALFGCDKLPFGQQAATPAATPAPAPAPLPVVAAPASPISAPAPAPVTAPAAEVAPPAAVAAAAPAPASAAAGPSLEVRSYIKQGFAYIAAAKNATSKANYEENLQNAINEFSQAIAKDPGYADAYSNRAVAYMLQKKYNKAQEDLKEAVKLAPKSPAVHYNLASLYSLKGDVDIALDEIDAALANGFTDYDSLRKDPDLDNVRRSPEFRKVLEKHKVFITK